ncbi:type II toxin-antitoxin system RelE/ParE family toxin [Candidatus Gottesmanbacteria bacterium]|nr:type II toxin-antitoxin system RelE/ParE family toxin [Candidatus Gottesmanbacteria bacterium]
MPAKNFLLPEKVRKSLNKLPPSVQNRLPMIFVEIKQNPIMGVKLLGRLTGYYKVRIGDYRIVYVFDMKKSTVSIVKIEHRQGVYR